MVRFTNKSYLKVFSISVKKREFVEIRDSIDDKGNLVTMAQVDF